jgi:hypothetical protein
MVEVDTACWAGLLSVEGSVGNHGKTHAWRRIFSQVTVARLAPVRLGAR